MNLYCSNQNTTITMKKATITKYRLSLMLVMLFSGFSSFHTLAQTWTPTHYWTFNNPSNPLADSVGNTPLNPAFYQATYSISNAQTGISAGRYLTVPASSNIITTNKAFSPDSGVTVEFLFRPGPNQFETINLFSRRDGAIQVKFSYPYFTFTTAATPLSGGSTTTDKWELELEGIGRGSFGYYVDGNWHHMVFRYNARTGVKDIWVDGQNPTGFSKTIAPGRIPNSGSTSSNNIFDFSSVVSYVKPTGDYDEIALYSYALPATMIYRHFLDFSTQRRSYTFANSTTAVPAASAITGGLNPQEFAPGHPNPTIDPIEELKAFPAVRVKPNHTLFPNYMVFNPSDVAGQRQVSYSKPVLKQRSIDVQLELCRHFSYAVQLTHNTTRFYNFADTNEVDGAFIKLANQNPQWKATANTYWPQTKLSDIGRPQNTPHILNKNLPAPNYLRNSSGQYLDMSGNVTTSTNSRSISPEAPLDSFRVDGQTQRFYLQQLLSRVTRPIDLLFENGEVIPTWSESGLQKDPTCVSSYSSLGLGTWKRYKGNRFTRLTSAYMNEWRGLSGLGNTRIFHYYLSGHPVYDLSWQDTRTIQSRTNNQYYANGDIYTRWPGNWRYWSGAARGWQYVVESRYEEIALGDKLFSPVVSPGWDIDEERNIRPAQWLGFLKAIAMLGAEHMGVGHFITTAPFQVPANYVWQMAMPGYVQGVTSRFDDLFFNGSVMNGDVPQSLPSGASKPGYSFYAGDMRKLISARKHNTLARYAITGTIQPNSNMAGNAELEGDATITIDGNRLTFKIRRQGSTYIYDRTNPNAPVFYQLDSWHENTHPYYWSKTFNLEAEIFDNVNSNLEIKTQVPAGTTAGDYRNYTSYITFKATSPAEYNFAVRGNAATTHFVWVRARSRGGVTTGFNLTLDGTQNHSVNCVRDTNWTWYRFNASNGQQITYTNLTVGSHKLSITPINANLEIDQITVTPVSGNFYSSFAAPCSTGATTTATITANGPTTLCAGATVGLTANSGTNYLWSTGATTQSIVVSTSGNYVVTVTGTNGTATSSPTTVSVNPAPINTITNSGSLQVCNGSTVTLTSGSTSGTYLWSNGATTRSITVNAAGSYVVTATGTNGCTSVSSTVAVTNGSASTPTITAGGSTSFCSGGNVSLSASSGSTYLWSNGATTQTITATTAGNYVVSVTQSNGCSAQSAATTITIGSAPVPTISTSGPTSICSGGTVTLTSSTGTAYLWSNGSTARSITVSAGGNYTVRTSQSGGCSATSSPTSVTVGSAPVPTITANGSTTFCQGSSVVLSSSAGTAYLWSNGATTQSITVSTSGNYTVRTSQSGGCSATSAARSVTVGSAPTPTITANGPTTFCNGGNVTLTASSGTAYAWSNGATTQSITVSASGNYTVRVSQTGGCSATSAATNVTVNTGSASTPTVSASGATTFCNGGSVTLTASSGSAYLWSNGATTQSILVTTGGNYNVRVTQTGGCSSQSGSTAVTVNPTATFSISVSGPLSFCNGGSVNFNVSSPNAQAFVWYRNNVEQYTGLNPVFTATTAGVYKMRAQLGQCGIFSIPYTVTVPCREGEQVASEGGFTVYPNPFYTYTTFAFELAQSEEVSIRLYDATGKLIDVIMDRSLQSPGETRVDYATNNLPGGMYIAEIVAGSFTKRIRLISGK